MPISQDASLQQSKSKRKSRTKPKQEVGLKGHLCTGAKRRRVLIGDITGSGAMLILRTPPQEGLRMDLHIEGFGQIGIEVAYTGDGLCGVLFSQASQHRDQLLKWLKEQLSKGIRPS